ncbi:OLC1v1012519C1 [Oldenlandia corymbosa var. corymbosa]|uniref:OLC1v1012519C1 n=1 Tax=Oldenlandia corymbosa var. corymbosa TaxID=529605 RepID=A0AAV1DW47_OLDCO|nr:OLC1v1012519C1 [Oldenlandia corymbosa var. corymbosa]
MASMPEKSMLPSRFLSCLIAISMFLLLLSSLSLLQFCGNSYINSSVFRFILVNTSSFCSKSDHILSETSIIQELRTQKAPCVNSTNRVGRLPHAGQGSCDSSRAILKVYMYDLPPEFHFGLLNWRGIGKKVWPDVSNLNEVPAYPGGLNLQHSIEYWLTLDLLSSNTPNVDRPCTAIRVQNSTEADIIFVPFFASLSYNRHSKPRGEAKVSLNKILQDKLVDFLKSREEWKRNDGKDHLIIAHHPNSLLTARKKLSSARFVLADFGRYPPQIAYLDKDIIAPYKHMVRTVPSADSPPFEQRPTLMYFQGAIYRKAGGIIRQELFYLLKDEKEVHFTFGTVQSNGIRQAGHGMASSKFCLNIAGDTPSSNRLFDAIASHCVPVIISDDIELPFEDFLDYSEFCIFVRASEAVKNGYLLNLLRGIKREKWTEMWERLKEITKHYEYQYPSRPNDAVDMIWQAVSRKISNSQLNVHRKTRYQRTDMLLKAE